MNNDLRILTNDELDAVSGAGPIVDAIHFAQAVGMIVAIYSRPAVETETVCGK